MSEIILGSVIVALVVSNIYILKRYFDTSEKYMKAFMAKNLTELSQTAILDRVDPGEKDEKKEDSFVPVEAADESIFKKFLKQIENGGQDELPEV